jgi:hypothetical protein
MFQVTAVSQIIHDKVLRDFQASLPRQPYASDNLEQDGIWRQSQRDAIRCKHIQANGGLITWLTFDCDHDATAFSHRDGLLPPPNIITLNPDNGRGHLSYRLLAPVAKTDAARDRPLRYLAAIETGMTRRLDADPGYVGLVTKNPLHPRFRTIIMHDHAFQLSELAEHLHADNMRRRQSADVAGLGRNCTVFEELRHFAYREVRRFKSGGATFAEYQGRLLEIAIGLNLQFAAPMHHSEVHQIGRSVANWTWQNFSNEEFSAVQSRRGRRGNAKRWGDRRKLRVAEAKTAVAEHLSITPSTPDISDKAIGQKSLTSENARITQGELCAEVAKKIGVSTRTVRRYLKGRLPFATAEGEKPWKREGISRATWYRRRARQKLCGSGHS